MTIFSIACYVIFGYLVVAGVLLYRKGFHKDVGATLDTKYTNESLHNFERPGAICLILAGVAGVAFTGCSDAGLKEAEIVAGILLVIFLCAYYYLKMTKLKKK